MSILSIAFEVAAVILLALFMISLVSVSFAFCIVPCGCRIYKKVSSTRRQEMELREDLEIKLQHKRIKTVGKDIVETAEALRPTICEMAESGAPAECMTDVTRSAFGTLTNQEEHHLSDLFLEAFKTLPAILNKN